MRKDRKQKKEKLQWGFRKIIVSPSYSHKGCRAMVDKELPRPPCCDLRYRKEVAPNAARPVLPPGEISISIAHGKILSRIGAKHTKHPET